MNLLKPAPVSIRQLSFNSATQRFTADISDTNGLGRVYGDACDEGLTVIGATGREVVFVVTHEGRNEDGITHWELRSTDGRFTMTLWND